jgi:hypothetical protein
VLVDISHFGVTAAGGEFLGFQTSHEAQSVIFREEGEVVLGVAVDVPVVHAGGGVLAIEKVLVITVSSRKWSPMSMKS